MLLISLLYSFILLEKRYAILSGCPASESYYCAWKILHVNLGRRQSPLALTKLKEMILTSPFPWHLQRGHVIYAPSDALSCALQQGQLTGAAVLVVANSVQCHGSWGHKLQLLVLGRGDRLSSLVFQQYFGCS